MTKAISSSTVVSSHLGQKRNECHRKISDLEVLSSMPTSSTLSRSQSIECSAKVVRDRKESTASFGTSTAEHNEDL